MNYNEKIHIQAGLTPVYGENGEIEFIGTDKAWNEYDRIINELECQNIDYKEPF